MENDAPITVVVRHRVKPGKVTEFEDWLRGITKAALRFEGHSGFHVIRPGDTAKPEYLIFFRFDTFENLEKWETSETRTQWLQRVEALTIDEATRERHTGLEVWFSPPSGRSQPSRSKMAMVTLLAIYPLILLVQVTIVPVLESWPVVLRTLRTG